MKRCALLLLLLLGYSWGAPVEQEGPEPASCSDPVVLGAARQAMDQINKDRTEGYVYSLRDLANAHIHKHGENSVLFYLTMNVLETNCSVLSKTHFKDCEVRGMSSTPVYGQCKVAIFISRVNRVVRLYKYNCVVRPVAPEKVTGVCPDCPTLINKDDDEIKKTVTKSLEKFNKESGLAHHFSLLQVTRATSGWGIGMIYTAEFTVQETTCPTSGDKPADCPPMTCEFAHKGFCIGSHVHAPAKLDPAPTDQEFINVKCEIYEPEAAEREKKLHLLGGETDHSHNDTQVLEPAQGHEHVHDHTKGHGHHDDTHKHTDTDRHHHSHDHDGHRHAHDHSHDHGHGHDHVHAHHEKAHDHSNDNPNQHHKYQHADTSSTHQHDHEMALDHDHKHVHLHEHEHHHHHHGHEHETHHHPEGMWRQIPFLGAAVTLPAFPDVPAAGPEVGVTLPLKPDPQIPGQLEPFIGPFPTKVSAQCPPPLIAGTIVGQLFLEDPEFKAPAQAV
ncbi:antihemorrhagic factor BJ46a-like [Eucyclogobius newberryi]|uniref:antihemorrhagic factor BJ46a-like n=1 Tax=Eucyclogobius newberryi TaxID=166745 RepID=UPI003B5AF5D5